MSAGIAFAFVVLLTTAPPARAQGSWSPVYNWSAQMSEGLCDNPEDFPFELAHAALIPVGLHAGSVLFWRVQALNQTGPCFPANTTQTFLWNPSSPNCLIQLDLQLSSDIFCAGASWDANGQLVVAGGTGAGHIGKKTYRFRPRTLGHAAYPGGGGGACGGIIMTSTDPALQPWIEIDTMDITRFYRTLLALTGRAIDNAVLADVPSGGATLVIGGPPASPTPDVLTHTFGSELWELLHRDSTNWTGPIGPVDTSLWIHTVVPPAGQWEPYVRKQGPVTYLPQVYLDSYPRIFQLSGVAQTQLFITSDTETYAFSDPTAPGRTWAIKLRNGGGTGLPPDWELWSGPEASVGALENERFYGTAVIFHTRTKKDRILVFGGSQDPTYVFGTMTQASDWIVNSSVQEFDPGANPADQVNPGDWNPKQNMTAPRVFLNAVVLPTGKIFLVGGTSAYDHFGGQTPLSPVHAPELYDPGPQPTNIGQPPPVALPATPSSTPRLYHSLALLLPDGRILVAGGHQPHDAQGNPTTPPTRYTGEIFSPSYMTQPRPAIVNAPVQLTFGSASFTVSVTIPTGYTNPYAVLLRPGAVTHHFDNDQRYIELDVVQYTGGQLQLATPTDDLGPAGWYMLFVVATDTSGERIPSVASFVQILRP